MRRIVDGLTYDTHTSDEIARAEWDLTVDGEERTCWATLYRTEGGAFFEVRETSGGKNDDGEEMPSKNRFLPMSESAAHKWVLEGDVELIDTAFVDAPEASAETASEPSATIYLRVTAALKKRVDEAAAAAELSINAFMTRCAESCLGSPTTAK